MRERRPAWKLPLSSAYRTVASHLRSEHRDLSNKCKLSDLLITTSHLVALLVCSSTTVLLHLISPLLSHPSASASPSNRCRELRRIHGCVLLARPLVQLLTCVPHLHCGRALQGNVTKSRPALLCAARSLAKLARCDSSSSDDSSVPQQWSNPLRQ